MPSSILQRFRHDIKTPPTYKNPLNSNERNQNISSDDPNRPQLTSTECSTDIETVKPNTFKKNKMKGGSSWENHGINDQYLDEILHNIKLLRELAMQIVSNDKTVRSNTIKG